MLNRPALSPKRSHRKRISAMRLSSDTTATLPEYNSNNYTSSTSGMKILPVNHVGEDVDVNMGIGMGVEMGLGLGLGMTMDIPSDKPPDYEYEDSAEEADEDTDSEDRRRFQQQQQQQQQPQNFTYSISLGSSSSKNLTSPRRKSRFLVPQQQQYGQVHSYQNQNQNQNHRRQRSLAPLPLNLNSNTNSNIYTPSHTHSYSYSNTNTNTIGDNTSPGGGDSVDPYLDALLERSVHALEISNNLLQSSITTKTSLSSVLASCESPTSPSFYHSPSSSSFIGDRRGYERSRNGGSKSGGGGIASGSRSGGSKSGGNGRFGRDRYREREREAWIDDFEEITRKVDRLFGNGEDDESGDVDERRDERSRMRGKAKGKEEWNRLLHSSFTTDTNNNKELNLSSSLPASVSPLHHRNHYYQQQGGVEERTKKAKRRPSLDSNSIANGSRLRLSYRTRDELVAPPPRALTQYIDVESGAGFIDGDGDPESEQFIVLPSTLGIRSVIPTPISNPSPNPTTTTLNPKAEWNASTASLQHTQQSPGPLHSTPALPVITDMGLPPSSSATPAYNKLAAFVLKKPTTTPVKSGSEDQGRGRGRGRGSASVGSTPVSSFIATTALSSFMAKRRNSSTGGGDGKSKNGQKSSFFGSLSPKKRGDSFDFGIGIGGGGEESPNQSINPNLNPKSSETPIMDLDSDSSYLSQSQSGNRNQNQNQNQSQSHIQKRIMTPPVEESSHSPSSLSSSSSSSSSLEGSCVAKQTVVSLRKILDDHSHSQTSTSTSIINSTSISTTESTTIINTMMNDGIRIKTRAPSFMPRTPMPEPVSGTSTATASISRMLTKKIHHSSTRPPNPPRQSALKGSRPVTPIGSNWVGGGGGGGGEGGGSATSSGVSTPTKRISFAELPESHVSSHPEKFKRVNRSRTRKGKEREIGSVSGSGSGSRFLVGTLGIDQGSGNESGNESGNKSGNGWLSNWFAPVPTTNMGLGGLGLSGNNGSSLVLARHEERLEDRISRGWGGRMSGGYNGYGYLDEWAI